MMELFGWVRLEFDEPAAGEGVRTAAIERTDYGDAMVNLLHNGYMNREWPTFYDETPVEPGVLRPLLQPYFPEYQRAMETKELPYLDGTFETGGCTALLDGLDEAPDRVARESLSKLIEKATQAFPECRFVVTSRPAAYVEQAVLPDFAHARIEPLSDRAVDTFLSRWCDALYAESPSEAQTHCAELTQALQLKPEIRRLARNPVMLTALAVVHWNERRLPEQRADLYDSIVSWLSRSREQRLGRQTAERTLAVLQELALAMQNHPQGRQLQVSRRWAAEAIAPELEGGPVSRHSIERAEQFLAAEEVDSGIVVGRGHDVRFWHLTFQEFLAAKALAGRLDTQLHDLLWKKPKKVYLPEWREVVLLLAGILHQQGRARVDGFFRSVLDDLGKKAKLQDQARCAGLLGADPA